MPILHTKINVLVDEINIIISNFKNDKYVNSTTTNQSANFIQEIMMNNANIFFKYTKYKKAFVYTFKVLNSYCSKHTDEADSLKEIICNDFIKIIENCIKDKKMENYVFKKLINMLQKISDSYLKEKIELFIFSNFIDYEYNEKKLEYLEKCIEEICNAVDKDANKLEYYLSKKMKFYT